MAKIYVKIDSKFCEKNLSSNDDSTISRKSFCENSQTLVQMNKNIRKWFDI